MTDHLPAPPVPADADLTDFKFMPLEVARLRRSKAWLICKRRPEVAFYMLNLWTASWHERPAGSLEDDDDVLADAAMCPPDRWAKVREHAMRGWVKHSDDRLYHPVVAEKVWESWLGKLVARWSKECDRIRKENHRRRESGQTSLDFPPKPDRKSVALPTESPQTSAGNPAENALKGQGRDRDTKGTGTGKGDSRVDGAGAPRPPDDDPIPLALDRRPEAEAVRLWNESAERIGLPIAQRLTDPRRKALKIRLSESGGVDGWRAALAKVEASKFLTGKTGRTNGHENWRCDLDFILREAKFTKLMEGGFDDPPDSSKPADTGLKAVLAGYAKAGAG